MSNLALNDYKYSHDEIFRVVRIDPEYEAEHVSVGMALRDIARTGELTENDFTGGIDGIDALVYHLDGSTVRKAIEVLQRVEKRFEEYSKAQVAKRVKQ